MKTKNLLTIFALLFASVATTFGQITITVNPLPTADAGIDQTIALGGSTPIGMVDAGDTYSWTSSPAGFTSTISNPTVSPIVPTTYYLVADNGTCQAFDTVFVNVTGTALAVASKVANPGTVCSGDESVLSIVPQGGTGTYTYSWNLVGDATVLSTNDTLIVNPTSAVDAVIRYHVLLDDGVSTVNDTLDVTVNALPVADAGADQSIVLGGSVQIGTADLGLTYSWTSNPAGFTSALAQPTVSPVVPTTYYLVADNGTCQAFDTVFVNVTGTALAVASKVANPGTVCSGDESVLSIVPQGGTGTYTFSWNLVGDATVLSTNDTLIVNPTSAVDAVIRYHVLLDDGVSTVNDTLDVTVNALPVATFGADASICFGDVIDLIVNPANGLAPYSVTMDNGTGDLVAPNNINPVIGVGVGGTATFSVQPSGTTTYHFSITDSRGCSQTY